MAKLRYSNANGVYLLFVRYEDHLPFRLELVQAPGSFWSHIYEQAKNWYGEKNVKVRWRWLEQS